MAFLFGDSFDHYATADMGLVYDAVGTPIAIAASGRNGTSAASFGNLNAYLMKLITAADTLIAAAAFKFISLKVGPSFLQFANGSTAHAELYIATDNKLSIKNGSGTVLQTYASPLIANTLYHIGAKVLVGDGGAGTWEVWLNGVSVMSGSGDTRNGATTTSDRVLLRGIAENFVSGDTVVDDFYILDTSGSQCNDFLGDIRGVSRFANADGTYTDFTASAGDRHDCVNKVTPTADAKYVKSLTPGHKVTFSFPAMGVTGNVKAVVNHVYAFKSDAGSRIIKPLTISGATESAGAEASLSDTGLYLPPVIHMVDPATSAAWANIAAVDAARVGAQMVS